MSRPETSDRVERWAVVDRNGCNVFRPDIGGAWYHLAKGGADNELTWLADDERYAAVAPLRVEHLVSIRDGERIVGRGQICESHGKAVLMTHVDDAEPCSDYLTPTTVPSSALHSGPAQGTKEQFEAAVEAHRRAAFAVCLEQPMATTEAEVTRLLDEYDAARTALLAAWDAMEQQRSEAQQRCEWVAAALHGDALYGPATEDPLYQRVAALRALHSGPAQGSEAMTAEAEQIATELDALAASTVTHAPSNQSWPAGHWFPVLTRAATALRALAAARAPRTVSVRDGSNPSVLLRTVAGILDRTPATDDRKPNERVSEREWLNELADSCRALAASQAATAAGPEGKEAAEAARRVLTEFADAVAWDGESLSEGTNEERANVVRQYRDRKYPAGASGRAAPVAGTDKEAGSTASRVSDSPTEAVASRPADRPILSPASICDARLVVYDRTFKCGLAPHGHERPHASNGVSESKHLFAMQWGYRIDELPVIALSAPLAGPDDGKPEAEDREQLLWSLNCLGVLASDLIDRYVKDPHAQASLRCELRCEMDEALAAIDPKRVSLIEEKK